MVNVARGAKMMLAGMALAGACGVASAQMQGGGTQQQPGAQQQQQQQPGMAQPNGANSPENQTGMNGTSQPGGMSMQDRSFLKEAASGGMFEIQAGQLAGEKGQSDDVKQFGAMMVKDHTQLNDNLKPFLQQGNVAMPTKLGGKEKKEYAKLQSLNGAAFDQAYVQIMTKDHEHDLSAFKEEASSTQQPGLKAAVMQGEQVITMHLDKIKQIGSTMGAASGM